MVLTTHENEDDEEDSESSSESSSDEASALHVNLNTIPVPSESGISEESSMFHEDVTAMGEQKEVARPTRVAVPMIDQSVGSSETDTVSPLRKVPLKRP